MAYNVFISFRYEDGIDYKNELSKILDKSSILYDVSEDEDRSNMSEDTIKQYLYKKLRRSSVIIVLLTPKAVNYRVKSGKYDDWLYDELRYSLEDREENRTKGVIAVYTDSALPYITEKSSHYCEKCKKTSEVNIIKDFYNLVKKNMMNVKKEYKVNQCEGIFDSNYDSYVSLVHYSDFIQNIDFYINIAIEKKENNFKYDIYKTM